MIHKFNKFFRKHIERKNSLKNLLQFAVKLGFHCHATNYFLTPLNMLYIFYKATEDTKKQRVSE